MDVKEPTSEQCTSNAIVYEYGTRVGFAVWYPQMGGYAGKAVVIFDAYSKTASCFDVLVWHDGDFPFSEGKPRALHHCSADQFICFGETIKALDTRTKTTKM